MANLTCLPRLSELKAIPEASRKSISQLQEAYEKVPYYEKSLRAILEDIIQQYIVCFTLKIRSLLLENWNELRELLKDGSKLPKELEPIIKWMEKGIKEVNENIKRVEAEMNEITKELTRKVNDGTTLSNKDKIFLESKKNQIAHELKSCENDCHNIEEALPGLKKKMDSHVARYTKKYAVGAGIVTIGLTFFTGGVFGVAGLAMSAVFGATAGAFGTAITTSGLAALIQVSKRERLLTIKFDDLESKLKTMKKFYNKKEVDMEALSKYFDYLVQVSDNLLSSNAGVAL
ncbi:uncharacterized protein LOC144649234 [Oculina patagonica]